MKKDSKTMKEVAELCTHYHPKRNCCHNSTKNSSTDTKNYSCLNCEHYESSNVCDLDLYEEIMNNHNL